MARGRHPARIHINPPSERIAAKYLRHWTSRDLHREPHRFPALTSPELFGNEQPLEIDFGCGSGNLACTRARQLSDVNFLGIDHSQKPLFCAVGEADKAALENMLFIHGNFFTMAPFLKPRTVSAAYYLLPNPPQDYHRERANDRRQSFLQSIYSALVPHGRFYFATDSSLYFECIHDILNRDLHLAILDVENSATDLTTGYWRLWNEKGRKVKSLMVEKMS